MATTVRIEAEDFRRAGRILALEADSGRLRFHLTKDLRALATPIVEEQRARLASIPSKGISPDPSIRAAISSRLKVEARLTGFSAGINLRALTTPDTRGFRQGPRRFNARSFRHPVFAQGSERSAWTWVSQEGGPAWFHGPAIAAAPAAILAAKVRLDLFAAEIAARIRARGA